MAVESNFLNDRQVEDLQMLVEIINAMAAADGFLDLESCLKKHSKRLNTYIYGGRVYRDASKKSEHGNVAARRSI